MPAKYSSFSYGDLRAKKPQQRGSTSVGNGGEMDTDLEVGRSGLAAIVNSVVPMRTRSCTRSACVMRLVAVSTRPPRSTATEHMKVPCGNRRGSDCAAVSRTYGESVSSGIAKPSWRRSLYDRRDRMRSSVRRTYSRRLAASWRRARFFRAARVATCVRQPR